ncbi:MAG: hypothetical protein LIP77_11275 [Planctomycetes bacterium]|nr:hypothetical protein [Planctomycetota bacterium]
MLTAKNKFTVVFLLAVVVLLTGQARLRLDWLTEGFRGDFREMLYLPRGRALRVIACGFDTPLADALFIKSLIYYAESVQAEDRTAARAYTYELFDVITDLSPRFYRAYQVGSLFLTASSSMQANQDGARLLDKGIAEFERLASAGERFRPDPRWLLYVVLANIYEVNIQTRYREMGDLDGASEARRLAGEAFAGAARSPGAPPYVVAAASGYASAQAGTGLIEDSLKAVLSVWYHLRESAENRGDEGIIADLDSRIAETEETLFSIMTTRELESRLSQMGQAYRDRHGTAPEGLAQLVAEGLLPQRPGSPLTTDEVEDQWLALPDGSLKSRILATMETENHLQLIQDALIAYRRANRQPAPSLDELVAQKYLTRIPAPPLAGLGQRYDYDAERGVVENAIPLGPDLPPDRQ